MEAVHRDVGVPFLPYLGRLALAIFEADPRPECDRRKSHTQGHGGRADALD